MTPEESVHRLTLNELLTKEGRSFEDIAEVVMFGDENAPALCSEGCEVEPDGTCQHGFPSVLRAAGLI